MIFPKKFLKSSFQLYNFRKSGFSSTIDPKEIHTFSKVSDWWQFSGSQQALKAYNFLRTEYIKQILNKEKNIDISTRRPFQNFDIVDVGSGGGLLCEVYHGRKLKII